jgi:hypothetical protein
MLLARRVVLDMILPRVPADLSDVRPRKVVCALQAAPGAHQDSARINTHPGDTEATQSIGALRVPATAS